jgi:rare lipoprotein A (peptidoglycan hydrolase)
MEPLRIWVLTVMMLLGAVRAQAGDLAVDPAFAHFAAVGMASWYGGSFQGGHTANGERFDMTSISAAHKSLPLPCYARVTNLRNGRSIVVRVNDRGPYARGRMIDVSARAASLLDFRSTGMARVKIEYLGKAPPAGGDEKFLLASLHTGSDPAAAAPLAYAVAGSATPVQAPALVALVSAFRAANDDRAFPSAAEKPSPFGVLESASLRGGYDPAGEQALASAAGVTAAPRAANDNRVSLEKPAPFGDLTHSPFVAVVAGN